MRMACAITDKALATGFERLHTGMTEKELAGIITAEIMSNGGGAGYVGVLFGEKAALPHGRPKAGRHPVAFRLRPLRTPNYP